MADPALPPNILREIAELRDRVQTLERANQLQASSVRGGAFVVLDDDGVEVARAGRLPNTTDGFTVSSDTVGFDHLHVNGQLGVALPWLTHNWYDSSLSKTVTSGTFAEVWRCVFELTTSPALRFRVPVNLDSSCTLELRVLLNTVQLGSDLVVAPSTVTTLDYRKIHGVGLLAGPVTLQLMARRTSVGGTGLVYMPTPTTVGMGFPSTPPGGWV